MSFFWSHLGFGLIVRVDAGQAKKTHFSLESMSTLCRLLLGEKITDFIELFAMILTYFGSLIGFFGAPPFCFNFRSKLTP